MLKPADPGPPPPDRPIGDLIHGVVEDGKSYARAEFELAKAIGAAKGKAIGIGAALVAAAFVFALAAVTALAVGVVIALETFVGPFAAGFLGMLIFAVVAGILAWYGGQRIRREL
jgi:fructose-specific phosphotransferase system IIC component